MDEEEGGKDAHRSVEGNWDMQGSQSGEEGWKNSEGERLRDFGLDEDVEFYDQDEIPLGELMRRRGMRS